MIRCLLRLWQPFLGVVCCSAAFGSPSLASDLLPDPYQWEVLHTVQQPRGMEVVAPAMSNGALITLSRPAGRPDRSLAIHYFDLQSDQGWQPTIVGPDPEAISCGSWAVGDNGLLCIGGDALEGVSRRVTRLEFDRDAAKVMIWELPVLPEARSQAGLAVHKNRLYVAGGFAVNRSDGPQRNLWTLDLAEAPDLQKWELLPALPGVGVASPRLVVQDHGNGDALYLFDLATNRFLEYKLKQRQWRPRRSPPAALGTSIFPVGTAHIFADSGFKHEPASTTDAVVGQPGFLAYHTITDTWVETTPVNFPGRLLASWEDADATVITVIDETGAVNIISGTVPEISSHFHILDYGVLVVYFASLIYMGHWFSKREKSTDDYFRGGKRVPGWAAGISIIGTKFSAVSFMSIPAKTFATNWNYFAMQISILLAAVIVIRYFIPFFCNLDVTTAYEYLERRFNTLIRLIGSLKFILFEVFRMGILVLLPSLVLSVITGIDIYVCVLIIGVVSTIYTMLGGIEAVIWTDVIQVFIMVGGTLFGIIYALVNVDTETFAAMSGAVETGKTQIFDFDFTLTTATIWVLFLSLPAAANNYVSNQTIVQRFISTKNIKQAARSMWVTAIVGPSILFLFYIMGTALYLFYQSNPAQLNPAMKQPDEVLAWYIVRELPVGISGLLVGAIFAATMSSLDSALSSTSTVFVSDIYRRFNPGVADKKALRLAKILTAGMGFLGTASAFLFVALEVKSLFDQFMQIMGLLGGGLAGIFILGTMTRRTHSIGVLVGFIVSIIVLYYTKMHTDLHFFLYGAVGMVTCVVFGYITSLLIPFQQKSLDGLTIHTPA